MPDKLIIISILLHRLNLCFLAHLIYVVRSTLLLNCLKEHINNFSRSTHSNKGWQDRWHYQITSFILRSLQPCVRKLRASEYRLQFWPITKGKRPWAAHVPALEKSSIHWNKLIIFFAVPNTGNYTSAPQWSRPPCGKHTLQFYHLC